MYVKVSLSVILVIALGTLMDKTAVEGCRSQVCRKRRAVSQPDVLLYLNGCTGQTKPWLRQISYCLGKSTVEVALKIKDWYQVTYQMCQTSCADVKRGTSNVEEIEECVLCFDMQLENAQFLATENVTIPQIRSCLLQYIYAALSNELPSFEAVSAERGKVTLPSQRPANNWWALTVKLPCKPPLFQFWNAYCINSFANDPRAQDFVLTQNRLVVSRDIVFLATFDDQCRFDVKDIQIVWSESVPGTALPQVSNFGSSFPSQAAESGNIFFDTEAAARLSVADGGVPAEFRSDNIKNPRRKRNIDDDVLAAAYSRLGFLMPCTVKNFKVTDPAGVPFSLTSNKKRHVLDTSKLLSTQNGVATTTPDISLLNFTLDYGYEETGCFFGSSNIEVIVNPPDGWIDGLSCFLCENALSEEDCRRRGREVYCNEGDVCESEIRQISRRRVNKSNRFVNENSFNHWRKARKRNFGTNEVFYRAKSPIHVSTVHINKMCKQKQACENNFRNNNQLQCKPGQLSSVCRCCCSTDLCNANASHCQ